MYFCCCYNNNYNNKKIIIIIINNKNKRKKKKIIIIILIIIIIIAIIQPMLISSLSELKVGFLYDITLAGQLDIVIKDVISIKDKTDKYGLRLNAAKCEVVYGHPHALHNNETLKNFQRVEQEDLTHLRAPVLPGRAVDTALIQKTEKLERAISSCHYSKHTMR